MQGDVGQARFARAVSHTGILARQQSETLRALLLLDAQSIRDKSVDAPQACFQGNKAANCSPAADIFAHL